MTFHKPTRTQTGTHIEKRLVHIWPKHDPQHILECSILSYFSKNSVIAGKCWWLVYGFDVMKPRLLESCDWFDTHWESRAPNYKLFVKLHEPFITILCVKACRDAVSLWGYIAVPNSHFNWILTSSILINLANPINVDPWAKTQTDALSHRVFNQ